MPLFDTLSDVQIYKSFGSGFRLFWGKVISNEDPKLLGRIKVQIKELLPWDDKKKLLWIYPLYPAGLGESPLTTNFQVPEEDSYVICIFPHDSIYFGFYVWHTTDRLRRLMDFESEYPERFGWQDSRENKFIVNKDPNIDSVEHRYADGTLSIHDSKRSGYEYRDKYGTEIYVNRKDQYIEIKFAEVNISIHKGILNIDLNSIHITATSIAKLIVMGAVSVTTPIVLLWSKIVSKFFNEKHDTKL